MRYRLLEIARCPECKSRLKVLPMKLTTLPKNPQISGLTPVCERYCPWGEDSPEYAHHCEECFSREIQTGIIQCEKSNHLYPITNGIPRFLPDAMTEALPSMKKDLNALPGNMRTRLLSLTPVRDENFARYFRHTQKSFSSEWAVLPESEGAWGLDAAARKKIFMRCFDMRDQLDLTGKKILDLGCGHGEVEMALLRTGAEVFASDISSSIDGVQDRLRKAEPQYASSIHIDQTNLHRSHYEQGRFDLVHCVGVLVATPDTYRGFKLITSLVTDGGKCYVELYSAELKNPRVHAMSNKLRKLTVRLPHPVLHVLCYLFACCIWLFMPSRFTRTPAFFEGSERDRVYRKHSVAELELSLFDNFSPPYQHHHTTAEARRWFASLGYEDIKKTFVNPSGFGMVGTMRRSKNYPPESPGEPEKQTTTT